ncbi:alpha/beta hydrolase-fold protein [Phenylobacterium sp.]|uniref:alpha/beta hydrolase n=1 Tax=Phenylobacterium sp. TaxID=1871053 RepID=UPI002600D169|nr:alpha/beta hydrolase-fold protein [Phenylobacterium sp.]MCA3739542.1 alpha/beta hydrolase [Phenylobacterium sp.]
MAESEFQRASIAGTRRFRLHSKLIGETFQIDVALPARPSPSGRPMPVAYVMDSNTVFGIAVQAARFLQDGDQARPAIIVGIGYCLDGVIRPREAYGALRVRDFTPSIDQVYLDRVKAARNGRFAPEDIRPAGGAYDFLEFLVEEVQPFIAEHYVIDPMDQTLVGSSLGGLFSLYAFFQRPKAFQQYTANSPSLWWSGGEMMDLADQFVGSPGPVGKMFMSVGGDEPNDAPWLMLDNFHHLTQKLRRFEGLFLTSHVFDGESHTSVIPAALCRGLRSVFASPS